MSKYLELVEGSFTQEHLDKQMSQYPYVAYSIKDDKVIYTIVPKEGEEKYTIYRAINYVDISNCTYNMVDLGLPSGLKWADRNVGAKNPEHYGSYFQWGDTNPYTYIGELTPQELVDLLNYLLGGGFTVDNFKDFLISSGFTGNDLTEAVNTPELNREFNWDNYFDTTDGGSTFNKYNNNGGLTVLESIDDAATIYMGSQYRMPTIDEIRELMNNTIQTFIDLNDTIYSKEQAQNGAIEEGKLKGLRFTGSNGNSIFIPTAGAYVDSSLVMSGVSGLLWSSSLYDGVAAWGCAFNYVADNIIGEELGFRCYGLPVRGVKEPYKKYLTFKAEEDNSSIGLKKLSSSQTMEYSTDTITWNTFDTTTDILLNKNEKAYIRGILSANNSIIDNTQFKMSGKIAAYGNCNALWNYEDLNAPLKEFCGAGIFADCTPLIIAPELPATTLATGCYMSMFDDCTLLTTTPELPTTTLASYCYTGMFSGCESLTTAPELPATMLTNSCYQNMFWSCTSLTAGPALPATMLTNSCYQNMFSGCKSLTVAPELPATTLATGCYMSMFNDCNNLNYIKCLATDISLTDCTYEWVSGVNPTGTFIKHPDMNDWTTGISGIPSGWTVENAVL